MQLPALGSAETREPDPVPVAPIAAIDFKGWTNAYALNNDQIRVVLVPEIGRIAHLGWTDGNNLLRLDPDLFGQVAADLASDDWVNFGGDWIWPVAQPHWPLFQSGNWPPSGLLDGRAWTGRAWRTEDGRIHSLITEDFGAPLHVRVHRTVRLHPTEPTMIVHQRLERLAESNVPVTLWQLSQLDGADYIFIPTDADSAFEDGLKPLLFDPPPPDLLHQCDEVAVYRGGIEGEHKLGSDSERRWIAALQGDTLIIQRTESGGQEGPYPDGGCKIEMFANADLGYVEIESLSVEKVLPPGESLDNTLFISLHRLTDIPSDPCALAALVQQKLGERAPSDDEIESVPEEDELDTEEP